MAEKLRAAIDEWRQADARARAVEKLLSTAFDEFTAGRGPAVPPEMVAEVAKARTAANVRLTMAMALMDPKRKS